MSYISGTQYNDLFGNHTELGTILHWECQNHKYTDINANAVNNRKTE